MVTGKGSIQPPTPALLQRPVILAPRPRLRRSCALYCLVARSLITGLDFESAVFSAVSTLRNIYGKMPQYEWELEWSIRPSEVWEGKESGIVFGFPNIPERWYNTLKGKVQVDALIEKFFL